MRACTTSCPPAAVGREKWHQRHPPLAGFLLSFPRGTTACAEWVHGAKPLELQGSNQVLRDSKLSLLTERKELLNPYIAHSIRSLHYQWAEVSQFINEFLQQKVIESEHEAKIKSS